MKFNLFEKAVEALNELKSEEGHGIAAPQYSVMLTQEDNLYIINRDSETVILEIKDEHTIINHYITPHDGGYHYIWAGSIDQFKERLEKRLNHKVKLHTWQQIGIYEKTVKALRDVKRENKYRKITKNYTPIFGMKDNVYVYDNGTILLEVKNKNKIVNHGNSRFFDPTWDAIVKIFEDSLKEG